jgi:hypothetical protein
MQAMPTRVSLRATRRRRWTNVWRLLSLWYWIRTEGLTWACRAALDFVRDEAWDWVKDTVKGWVWGTVMGIAAAGLGWWRW